MNSIQFNDLPLVDNYRELFLHDTPLIDTRAPVEFEQGSFPTAANLPLLNDAEREQIGIRYKQKGHDQAVALGAELISGDIRESRTVAWAEFARQHPEGMLFCFRGGMRSRIAQQWIYDATGVAYPRVTGGYKKLRRFLIEETERISQSSRLLVLGGRTGSGKTRVLNQLPNQIDLEGHANHRGSAFGPNPDRQPTQITFENRLGIDLVKKEANGFRTLVFEDEGTNIGSVRVPLSVYQQLGQSPLVVLSVPLSQRIETSLQEYVTDTLATFIRRHGPETGFQQFSEYLLASLGRIRKRLGGERHASLRQLMQHALTEHQQKGELDSYRPLIEQLLTGYYDPMYDYQISRKTERIVFEGDRQAVLEYLHSAPAQH